MEKLHSTEQITNGLGSFELNILDQNKSYESTNLTDTIQSDDSQSSISIDLSNGMSKFDFIYIQEQLRL